MSKTPRAALGVLKANMKVAAQRCTHVLQLVGGRHGNRLGLLLFATRPVALVPPDRGRMHLDRLASALGAALLTVAGGLTVFLVSGECRKAGRLSPGRVNRPAIG